MELKYAGYIFDCDGTLTDSMPLHAIAWEETMARYGVSFPPERCYSMGGMPTTKIIDILAAETGIELDAVAIGREKEMGFLEKLDQLQPVHQVVSLVYDCIAAGKSISVASGSERYSVDKQLQQIGLEDVFSIIVTAEDTELHKPEPDVFLRAAELMGIAPKDCIVYEDSDLGIQAAESGGIDWVDVRCL